MFMINLIQFREELFALIHHLPAENRHLFEPFVCHGNPFDARIFFVGANGVLDGTDRKMLPFLDYWTDTVGFDFWRWYEALKGQRLSKTRRNADKMIQLLNNAGFKDKVLSTNVFSVGSPRLADLKKDSRSEAPFRYLLETLHPEFLYVFGSDAENAFENLWTNKVRRCAAEIEGVRPFELTLNGRIIPGIFTKHLCYQTGNNHLNQYAGEIVRHLSIFKAK